MQLLIRRTAWPIVVATVILGLTVGVALAHEGRPVGDYRFIVGWLEEPTYEGSRNAVSVRVNKVVEKTAHDDSEGHHAEDPTPTPDGHGHDEQDPTPTPESHRDDHDQGPNPTPEGHENGDAHNGDESQDSGSGMTHGDEGGYHDGAIESASAMSVDVDASVDPVSGVNVHIKPVGFTFAPDNINQEHMNGEGHAHIYVDGVKVSRVYTPWFHLDDLARGIREIEVTLNANSHQEYARQGQKVMASARVTVPESGEGMHHDGPESVEADNSMSVAFRVEPDAVKGANLFITDTQGLTFAPQNAGNDHVSGEGHAYVYVNGVKIARLYGNAFQLEQLAEGNNEVRVTLNANSHAPYIWNGQPVETTVAIHIEPGMSGEGYGDHASGHDRHDASGHDEGSDKDHDQVEVNGEHSHNGPPHDHNGDHNGMVEKETSRSIVPQGAAKPLASIAGQAADGLEPVEGLEGSLKVEVTHVASGASKTLDLEALLSDPGHYTAGLIPTSAGVYEFRVFGDIEGTAVDETFVSEGAGGAFDDVRTSAELQFPIQLPEVREIESGVRGAMQTAQQAQDTALEAQSAGGNTLAIVALIVGIVGAVLGAAGIYMGLRNRQA